MEMKESSKEIKTGSLCTYDGLNVLVIKAIKLKFDSSIKDCTPNKVHVLFPSSSVDSEIFP